MAKATVVGEPRPPIKLELSGEEARLLFVLLGSEVWPSSTDDGYVLNDIYHALGDAEVTE